MVDNIEVLKLYTIDDTFIEDLKNNVDPHVFANTDPYYKHSRKYLGVLLEINGYSYYAPLSSPKDSDYMIMKGNRVIRNSVRSIIRMVETDAEGNRHLLGTIKLSNMMPVPSDKLQLYDLDNESDKEYKDLVLKEKRFINRNKDTIIAYAEVLYKEKSEGVSTKGYLNSTFDFKGFEKYISEKYLLSEKQDTENL